MHLDEFHRTFNPGVAGSIPARPTKFRHENRPLEKFRGLVFAKLPMFCRQCVYFGGRLALRSLMTSQIRRNAPW